MLGLTWLWSRSAQATWDNGSLQKLNILSCGPTEALLTVSIGWAIERLIKLHEVRSREYLAFQSWEYLAF